MSRVVGRDTDLDLVSNQDLNPVLLHATGKTSPHNNVIIALDFHDSSTQNPGDLSFQLDEISSTQSIPQSVDFSVDKNLKVNIYSIQMKWPQKNLIFLWIMFNLLINCTSNSPVKNNQKPLLNEHPQNQQKKSDKKDQAETKEEIKSEPISCHFLGDAVITEATDEARELYNKSVFGSLDKNKVQLSLLEAMYLLEKGRIII